MDISLNRLPESMRVLSIECPDDYEWEFGDGWRNINLTRLTNLRELSLRHIYNSVDVPFDDTHLTGLTLLSSLSLCGFGPVDPSFLQATFPTLEKLELDLLRLTPDHPAVPPVPNAPLLRTLNLSLEKLGDTEGQGEDVAGHDIRFDLLPRLERLVLVGVRPNAASLLRLHGLRGLREVVLCCSEPRAAGVLLAGLPNVQCVDWERRVDFMP
jgi:hypothetical protein